MEFLHLISTYVTLMKHINTWGLDGFGRLLYLLSKYQHAFPSLLNLVGPIHPTSEDCAWTRVGHYIFHKMGENYMSLQGCKRGNVLFHWSTHYMLALFCTITRLLLCSFTFSIVAYPNEENNVQRSSANLFMKDRCLNIEGQTLLTSLDMEMFNPKTSTNSKGFHHSTSNNINIDSWQRNNSYELFIVMGAEGHGSS